MTIAFLFLTAFFLCPTWASLSGSNWITPQVYVGLDHLDGAGAPACGMSYASLDLSRITAVQDLDLSTDCTKCIKVVNTRKPSKYVYVLAVDLGGAGLGKVSIPSFKKLFGQQTDPSPASWSEADAWHCAGIYRRDSSPRRKHTYSYKHIKSKSSASRRKKTDQS